MSDYTQNLIDRFTKQYGLSRRNDFWALKRGRKETWIIKHRAIEIAAAHEGITWELEVLNFSPDVVVKCTAKHGDRVVQSFGECSPKNNKNNFPYAMAEKRAVDRCVLKLLNAHAYLYSDQASDEFSEPESESKYYTSPIYEDPVYEDGPSVAIYAKKPEPEQTTQDKWQDLAKPLPMLVPNTEDFDTALHYVRTGGPPQDKLVRVNLLRKSKTITEEVEQLLLK
tara:strand:- start:225 stop:899 length:675 start_codon:yes stop_codon:yes gene_type:complete